MKKAINFYTFTEGTSIKKGISLAKAAGFEGIELTVDEAGELTIDVQPSYIMEIKRLLDNNDIKCTSLCSWLPWKYPLTSNSQSTRRKGIDIIKKMIDMAAALGADTVLVEPGYVGCDFFDFGEIVQYDIAIERSRAGIKELASHAEACKIYLGIENVWNKMLLSPIEMRDFIDSIGSSYVGAYFDVANCMLYGYPEHWIRILGSRIKKVHFKDYRRDPGGFRGFVELLAGDVNFPEVVKALKEVGFDDYCVAEIMPTYTYFNDAVVFNTSCSMDYILGRK